MVQTANALVVDASVAAKWHLTDEPDAGQAARIFQAFLAGQLVLVAPSQIKHEVPSSIAVATLGSNPRLTQAEGEAAVAEFLAIDLVFADDTALALSAYYLVHRLGIAYYDALYVALAQRHALSFVTADHKLYARIRHLPAVMWLADWRAPTTEGTTQ